MNLSLKYPCFPSAAIRLLLFAFAIITAFQSTAKEKEKPLDNEIFKESIHSVRFYREGWEFSMPILELGSDQHLILRFDDLTQHITNYSYTITHCDFDWFPSRLMTSEYLKGFNENPLNDYKQSINTTIPYVNYFLAIPNENTKPLLSGNYLLTIFEEGKKEKPVLTRKFYVQEPATKIEGIVKKATYDSYKGPNQEIDFSISYPGINMQDPRTEVKVAVLQNSRGDNAVINLKPQFVRDNQLIYDYSKENVFQAGNEFRNFDTKNLQTNGRGVESIEFLNPLYHIFLQTDLPRNSSVYTLENDLNGHYLVKNDRASDPELESDYVVVHFSLRIPPLQTNSDIYIFGELSDWKCCPDNRMVYDPKRKIYEGTALVKQGFYDYQYLIAERDNPKIDYISLEGSHVETENNYQILVYYRGFASRYDRLIGFKTINSLKQ